MKILIAISLILSLLIGVKAQDIQFNSDFSSTVLDCKQFGDHILAYGSYKGNANIGQQRVASAKNKFCLMLLDKQGNCLWIHDDTHEHILDYKILDNTVYYLDREQAHSGDNESYTLFLNSMNLDGSSFQSKEISKLEGKKYKLMIEGKFGAGKSILTCHSWRDQKSAKVNSKTVSNTHYGAEYYTMTNFEGSEQWSNLIEGGSDGYTETDNEMMISGKNATYIITAFGNIVKSGEFTFTSKLISGKNDPMKLYEDKSIITKIDATGNVVDVKELSVNKFEVRTASILANGNLAIGGDFTGNDSDFIKQALLLGKKMPKTQISPWDQQPSNDGYVVVLSENMDLEWIHTFSNPTYALVTKITSSPENEIALKCEYMSELKMDDTGVIKGHSANEQNYDSYVICFSAEGEKTNSYNFVGPNDDKMMAFFNGSLWSFYGSINESMKFEGNNYASKGKYNNGLILLK